jgi:flagellar biosynthesis chaperone FliJ
VLCLWRCNHQANQWLHQSCKRGNEWFHPYHKATYEKENRGNPPYFDSLPPTLTPTTKPKLQKLLTKEEFITALESLPTKDRHTKAAMAKALEISTTTLRDKAKAFELILNNYTISTKPKLTKEEFITALESLPTVDRHTVTAMAKALEIRRTALYNKAKRFKLNLNNYMISEEFIASLESLPTKDRRTQAATHSGNAFSDLF